jgi:hypothetical protein
VSLDSSSNAGAIVIKGKDLQSLSDNPEDLQSDLQALAGPAAGPSGGSIYIDGFSTGQIPPKESIREVRVNQDPFSPEFDKLGFGRIEIFTKPGSAKWHGSAGFNFADDIWNSRNPYAAKKAPLLLQESENTFGGPLSKRASFTLELEYHAVNNGSVINAVILDPNSFLPQPYTGVDTARQRHLLISPRLDYQLDDRNSVSFRYNSTQSHVDGFGIGQFDLPSRGYRLSNRFDTFQAGETFVAGAWVNEVRYQLYRWQMETTPSSTDPAIQVLGAFAGGGAPVGQGSDIQTNHELQDYVSAMHGAHTFTFGARLREAFDDSNSRLAFNGLYTFSSIAAYQATLLGLQSGLSPEVIRAQGGGPSQYSVSAGNPALSANQFDAGLFGGDSWRIRENLLLNLGLRYEAQTNIRDHADFAPRLGVAWSPHLTRQKTVIRVGSGVFYDRFALANTVTAERYNGVLQQQFVLTNPDTYPAIPSDTLLQASGSPEVIWEKDAKLRTPYIVQSAATVEQQLSKSATLTFTYTNAHAVHVYRSLDINAPLPDSGVYPYGVRSPIYLMTSSGLFNQNQAIASFAFRPKANISAFGYYVYNHAMSNSDGITTFPANPYNYSGEYGPSSLDIHHRILFGGSFNLRGDIRISPYLIWQSSAPFDITTGTDLYGTAMFNARPGIATPGAPGAIDTAYGWLDPNPTAGEALLPRDYGRGPGQFTLNLRAGKTFGFGGEKGAKTADSGPHIDATKINTSGSGMRGLFSAPSSGQRYSLTVGISARNLTNHTNPGPIIGVLTSPLFGQANQIAGTPNGEGFLETASNRRLELQIKFAF